MYNLLIHSKKVEKKLDYYIKLRDDIRDKIDRLKNNPYKNNGAHKLKGKLSGKWAC